MKKIESAYSVKEEIFNSVTHGIGFFLSIAGLVLLVTLSVMKGMGWHIAACTIYGVSMMLLYLSSTLYHSIPNPSAKYVFKIMDHCSIFLLIAGTYTPFLMITLHGSWGWSLFIVIWSLAFIGIIMKIVFINRFKILSTVIYLLMGWIVMVAIKPLLNTLPFAGFMWLLAGGLFYSGGVVFYMWKKLPLSHGIWHLFVLAGSICHFIAVLFYVIPS